MAIDGHRSTFVGGGSIDQFTEMVDLSPNEKVAAQRWQTLKLQESLTSAEQIEFNNLTTQLSNKIFSAEKFNTLADCIVALEIFFRDNVEGYIETKQQEFDATLQKFSDKGIWSNTTTYQQWNTISFNNETFLSRKDNNLNHTPIGDETDIWWQKIAQRGKQGQPGLGLRFTGLFSISKTYSENDVVAYYGDDGYAIYYCLSSCMGIEPTDENYWAIFMSVAQMSSIIGDTNDLLTEDKSSLVNAFNEVFLSVSSGKTQLETAITDMRGAVSKEKEIVSFNELENGVRSIPIAKGNAQPEHVLEPYTFTNDDGIEYTGAMPTKGAATYNPSQSDQIITSGQYLSGNQTIKAVTFDASKVLNDTTIAGKKGTIPQKSAQTYTPKTTNQTIASGQYLKGTQTIKGDANLVPANIKNGVSIFGVAGTVVPFTTAIKSVQRGLFVSSDGGTYTVPINAVDMNSAVLFTVLSHSYSNGYEWTRSSLANSTSIEIYARSKDYRVSWQVVEFNNIKSIQRGISTLTGSSKNETLNAVNMSKSIVVVTGTTGIYNNCLPGAELTSETNLHLYRSNDNSDATISWQVVEFK